MSIPKTECPSWNEDVALCEKHGPLPHHHLEVMDPEGSWDIEVECSKEWDCSVSSTIYVNDQSVVDGFVQMIGE